MTSSRWSSHTEKENEHNMNAIIIEDEYIAAQSLERLLHNIDENILVISTLQTVEESVEWLSSHDQPDLVFMDIHLSDGDSFAIFDRINIEAPIIFTTAYDEYALKAFEVNSIDYLLKPITRKDLEKALEKMKRLTHNGNNDKMIEQLVQSITAGKKQHKRNFLIPYKDKLIPLSTEDIAYISSEDKMARIVCFDQKSYTMDLSLDELMRQLSPQQFFRANRQYIIAHRAISDIVIWFNGKLALTLLSPTPDRVIVSRARAGQFKEWYVDNAD